MLALIKHDNRDLWRNTYIIPILFIPVLISVLINLAQPGTSALAGIPFWLVYAQVLVGLMVVSSAMAEEKEKGTLQALLVTPATFTEIVIARSIFALVLTVIAQLLVLAFNGIWQGNMVWLIILMFLLSTPYVALGLVIGYHSPTQRAAGMLATPVMLLFLFTLIFSPAKSGWQSLLGFMPNTAGVTLLHAALNNATINSRSLVIVLVWALLCVLLAIASTAKQVK